MHVASSPEVEGVTGKYFAKCHPVPLERRELRRGVAEEALVAVARDDQDAGRRRGRRLTGSDRPSPGVVAQGCARRRRCRSLLSLLHALAVVRRLLRRRIPRLRQSWRIPRRCKSRSPARSRLATGAPCWGIACSRASDVTDRGCTVATSTSTRASTCGSMAPSPARRRCSSPRASLTPRQGDSRGRATRRMVRWTARGSASRRAAPSTWSPSRRARSRSPR